MLRHPKRSACLALSAVALLSACGESGPADLVLLNGRVYTMVADAPWASAVVIKGNRVTAVASDDAEAERYVGPETTVIDAEGRLVLPGFVDAHTHLGGYGAQLVDVDLMDVSDDTGLRAEMARLAQVLEPGQWIVGGRWEGHKIWQADWQDREAMKRDRWRPGRATIDDLTPEHPALLNSYDRDLYLANTAALEAAGLVDAPLAGMELYASGAPTGLIDAGSPALDRIREAVQPKSQERTLDELRAAFAVLAERGITEIHDLSSDEQMHRYAILQERGQLTARVWARPHITEAARYRDEGKEMGTHPVTGAPDRFLRIGAYKGHYDGLMGSHGALLSEPYSDRPDTRGHYRPDTSDDPDFFVKAPDKFYEMARIALEDGFSVNTHAIGDGGVAELLDDYARLAQENGGSLDRFRVIHAEVVRPEDFARFVDLDLIAEVNPSQMEDDMRWVQQRLGPERERLVFPFRSYLDQGVRMTFGSDIPGAQGADFSNHPALAMHAAVHRTNTEHRPEGGWIPEQKITVHEALEAFTVNGAYAAFDEDVRGRIAPGMLADLAVTSVNILEQPDRLLDMEVVLTVVDGRVVYQR